MQKEILNQKGITSIPISDNSTTHVEINLMDVKYGAKKVEIFILYVSST